MRSRDLQAHIDRIPRVQIQLSQRPACGPSSVVEDRPQAIPEASVENPVEKAVEIE